ncbi:MULTISPECIES: hypothetical protein [Pseudomonas chlororaphis group]|uniref:hypothetical protein n=1 Tax=Pseudomonas chlororaphis group TaxID=136842 RepID=UPI00161F7B01|nr:MULTISPECIES: hypothetical protein [Pseudomonas chlororaphis group]MCO7580325.1 hypothetical protein [Pseudomonas protegens]MCO7586374.1 hypothetical protein [Pseudomonas chlororaphis]MCO7603139.1 hypothetical protein [Pseudomonas chlororaphis]
MSRVSVSIRLLFTLCLLAASFNHLRAALDHGLLWDYGYGVDTPLASRAFWGSLSFFDPLAALLLWLRPRWGLLLTLAIIVLDVVHNSFYVAAHSQWLETFYLSQVGFGLAVLVLLPLAWRGLGSPPESKRVY